VSTVASGKQPLLTRAFMLLAASHSLHALSFHLFLHLPGFLKGLGAGELAIGLMAGVASFTAIGARPMIGGVMDRRGRCAIIRAGGLLGILSCLGYLLVSSLSPLVWVVRALHGVSEAMLFASLFAYAADIVPASRRIEGIGLFGISGMLPMAVGGLLGDALLSVSGYATLFQVALGCSVVATLLSLPLTEPTRETGEAPRGILAAVTDSKLLPLWASGLCFATAIGSYFGFLKTFLLANPIGTVGDFFGTYAVTACLLRLLFGRVPERFGPSRVLTVALIALFVGLITLAFGTSRIELMFAGLLTGVGHGWAFPILLGLVVTRARSSERGAALAIYTALFDAGTLLGAPLWGAIIEKVSYPAMFCLAAGLIFLGGLINSLSAGVARTQSSGSSA
jgi:MFS family permease